jgi:hypothetical protein
MSSEYDLGYFEGLRNAMIAYMRMPDKDQFFEWLCNEVKEAKSVRDGE